MLTETELFECTNKKIVVGNKERENTYVHAILILVEYLHDRFVTQQWKISRSSRKISENPLRQSQCTS